MAMLEVHFNFAADKPTVDNFLKEARDLIVDEVDTDGMAEDNVMVEVCTEQHILLGHDVDAPCAAGSLTIVEDSDMLDPTQALKKKERNGKISKQFHDLLEDCFLGDDGKPKIKGQRFYMQFHSKEPGDFGHGGGTFDQMFCTIL